MDRFYIVPIEVVGKYRGPEYFTWAKDEDLDSLDVRWSLKDYGRDINQGIVAAEVDVAQHAILEGKPDVWSFPEDLETNPTAQELNALSAFMETIGIPANWLNVQDTYITVIRTITGMFLYMQRVNSITKESPLTSGVGLNDQYQNLPALWHDAIRQASDEFGYPWIIEDNWQVRRILKEFADLWGDQPIHFGFVTI